MEVLELALVLQERAEGFGAQAVGHRNGESNLVGDFGAAHGVFGTDVAAQDDRGIVAVLQGVADVFLGGIVDRVEVLENDQVEGADLGRKVMLARTDLQHLGILECGYQAAGQQVLARTGTAVEVEGLVVDSGQKP